LAEGEYTMDKTNHERLIVFLDYANINAATPKRGEKLDYGHLLNYLGEGRFLVEAHCYVPIDPRNPNARDREIEELWNNGLLVHTKMGKPAGDSYKCDFDVELTMDAIRCAHEVCPDIVLIASGDEDFMPVVIELRRRGIRVEVASFLTSAARQIILKSSGFINLDAYLEETASEYTGQDQVLEEEEYAPEMVEESSESVSSTGS
jgi:uncharacterized LabA/DUF88 family protein